VSHKVHGDCHFLRSGCRLGSIKNRNRPGRRLWCTNQNDKKNPTPRSRNFGTPVALLSSLKEDGSTDLAPISSVWALGWTLILGLLSANKTADNLARQRECVVNLPSREMCGRTWKKLTPLTGNNPVPKLKSEQFRFKPRKFAAAELTPVASEVVGPARAKQCPPVHREARVTALHQLNGEKLSAFGGGMAAEVDVARVHVADDFILQGKYTNPANWSPLKLSTLRSAG
jgi:flavin reductase (DIM6/NTAB) family NADH-FMN oxidoreductase RutF